MVFGFVGGLGVGFSYIGQRHTTDSSTLLPFEGMPVFFVV